VSYLTVNTPAKAPLVVLFNGIVSAGEQQATIARALVAAQPSSNAVSAIWLID